MIRVGAVVLFLLLVGCNNDGSFHFPGTSPDRTLSASEKSRQQARLAICDDMQGAQQSSVDFCRAGAGQPETANSHTMLLGPMGLGGTFTYSTGY